MSASDFGYSPLFEVFSGILASRKLWLWFFMKTTRHLSQWQWQWHRNPHRGHTIWISSTTSLSNGLNETSFNSNASILPSIWPTISLNNWSAPSSIVMSIINLARFPQRTAVHSHNSNWCYLCLKSMIKLCHLHPWHQFYTHTHQSWHAFGHAGHGSLSLSLAHCIKRIHWFPPTSSRLEGI
jgi:hypothetical protein